MKRIIFAIAILLISFQVQSQNVGIGVTTPAPNFKLHVHDNVSTDVSIGISNSVTSEALGRGIRLRMASSDFYLINQEPTGNIHFVTSTLNRMAITQGGNVGIGTTIPDYTLHIAKAVTEASLGVNATGTADQSLLNLSIDSRAGNNSLSLIKYRSGTSGTTYGIPKSNLSLISSEAGSGPLLVGTNQNSDLYFATNAVERMRITNEGQVRINSPAIGSGYAWLKVDNSNLSYNIYAANTNTVNPAYSIFASITSLTGAAVMGASTSGGYSPYSPGRYGVIGTGGASATGVGAFTISGGTALKAVVTSGSGTAIYSAGNLQFTGIGEAANKVLTTDASGNATWQNIPVTTGTWSVNGNDIYNSNTGNVGIGTTTPAYTLDVTGGLARTGNFVNTASSSNSYGVYASCNNTAGFGTGLWAKGGIYGVQADATLPGTGSRVGVHGVAGSGTSNMGVFGDAFGGTTAIGVYARALGATNNWAGYFEGGNVYIQNNLGIGTSTPNADALLHLNVGASLSKGFLVTGSNSGGTVPNLGAGKRMMFYPGKAAFRAGSVWGTEWDDANVGAYSMAFGDRTIASGQNAAAMGTITNASGYSSTAMGGGSTASGAWSTASGYYGDASGENSVSMGIYTSAGGYASNAFGSNTVSKGYASTALGLYNDPILVANQTLVSSNTPLFIIGNGTDISTRSNALVVQKNGKVYIDPSNKNDGTLAGNALYFGQYDVTGEAIGSKRTATGNAYGLDFFTAYTNRMSIANNGNVGIGTDAPISTLHVKGTVNVFNGGLNTHLGNFWQGNSNVDGIEFVSNGSGDAYIGIQRTNAAGLNISRFGGAGQLVNFYVGGASVGNIATSGANLTFNSTSDMRLKENIIPTKTGMHTLMEIDVNDYNYKADIKKEMQTGFLAQELYKIFPQAVTPGGEDAHTNPWTIDYSKLTPLLVKSIQEQQNEMNSLKKENADQQAQINQLNKRLENLEKLLIK